MSDQRDHSQELPSVQPEIAGSKKTVFRLAASAAKNVLLAADFTEWKKSPLKMVKGADGVWKLKVNLAPGRYRYQFLLDVDAQNAHGYGKRSALPFGPLHGIVEVRV